MLTCCSVALVALSGMYNNPNIAYTFPLHHQMLGNSFLHSVASTPVGYRTFTINTGTNHTFLTTEFAEELGIVITPASYVFRTGTPEHPNYHGRCPTFHIGPFAFGDFDCIVNNTPSYQSYRTLISGPPFAGILGLDFLQNMAL